MSVSSRVSSELPDILPADEAEARWPYTVVPLGATTTSTACRFVSSVAVNLYPAFCLLESMESTIRISTRVPAGTVTVFAFCAAAAVAAIGVLSSVLAEELVAEPWYTVATPARIVAAQIIAFRISCLLLPGFTGLTQQLAMKKRDCAQ